MISVIICSPDPARSERAVARYAGLLSGREQVEFVPVVGPPSLCAGYNEGVRRSTGDILLFSHDDVEVLTPDFADRLRRHLSAYDLVGLAGTTRMISGMWAAAGPPHIYGQVAHVDQRAGGGDSGYSVHLYSAPGPVVGDIQGVDGLLFATRRAVAEQVQFDAETFRGFHLYDADFSFRAYLAGFRLAVCTDVHVIHDSLGRLDDQWRMDMRAFQSRFGPRLHNQRARRFRVCMVEVATKEEVVEVMTAPHLGGPLVAPAPVAHGAVR